MGSKNRASCIQCGRINELGRVAHRSRGRSGVLCKVVRHDIKRIVVRKLDIRGVVPQLPFEAAIVHAVETVPWLVRSALQNIESVDTRSSAFAFDTPPATADRFRTDDADELRSYLLKIQGPHSREILGHGPVGYELWRLRCGPVEVNRFRQRVVQVVRGEPRACLVHVPLSGGLRYSFGRRSTEVKPGEAQFLVPGQRHGVYSEPGVYLAVSLQMQEVQREVRPYLGRASAEWQPARCTLLMSGPAAAEFREHLDRMVQLVSRGAPESTPPLLQIAHADLLAWLGRNLYVSGGVRRASPMTAARARDAEEWIAAHLDTPITLGRLCEVAGVGGRALQRTFMLRHGVPPMQYVTERRLEAVRARLHTPDPDVPVTRAAMEYGFTHMGRFSILYRQRFGESPSTTRRRALWELRDPNQQAAEWPRA